MKTALNKFIRQVIFESDNSLDIVSLNNDIKTAKDAAAAIRTFKVIQSYVKGAKSLGEFLVNLPIGSKVWQWQENTTMKDGVFVIKDIDLGKRPQSLFMILQKGDDGSWTSPVYFNRGQFLQSLVKMFVKPESLHKFDKAIRSLSLPILLGPGDMSAKFIGSILITPATHVPDWAQGRGADSLMLMKDIDVQSYVDQVKNNPIAAPDIVAWMYGVSIPDPGLSSDGIVPINIGALKEYDEQGAVTLEVHQGSSVYEVDVMKDSKTGRPVAYPRIPL